MPGNQIFQKKKNLWLILNSVLHLSWLYACTNAIARNPNEHSGDFASDGYHKYKVWPLFQRKY
jgi:hypothetical protein